VIIGRLIPARFDRSEEGRELLGIEELGTHEDGLLTGLTRPPETFEEALAAIGDANAAFSHGGPVGESDSSTYDPTVANQDTRARVDESSTLGSTSIEIDGGSNTSEDKRV
jgi:hypothetical protein